MVESDLVAEKVEYTEVDIQSGSQGLGFQRDPSFSGWCYENEIAHSDHQFAKEGTNAEDFGFELPLLQEGDSRNRSLEGERSRYSQFEEKNMQLNGGGNMDGVSTPRARNRIEKFVPLDIEYGYGNELRFPVVGDDSSNSMDSHEASPPNCKSSTSVVLVLKTLFLIFLWYIFSTSLTLYNKTLLGDDLGRFPAPLMMNTFHFALQAILSKTVTCICSQRFQPRVTMSWRDYFVRVVPTALGTALDINLSNASLVFITVTFATMCKSASPIFLLLFAFAFRLESLSIKLLGIILIISVGILLTVAKETEFELWGFIFVMLASVMSGFRWSMTQILLQKETYGLKNPLTLMSYVAPVMAVATAILSLILDPWNELRKNDYFNSSWHITRSCLLMVFGGTLAFFMVLTEYVLVSITSAVTVTIAGVVKEVVTILVAGFYFHDQFTWMKGVGLFIIMVGVSLFNWYKYQKLQKGEMNKDMVESPPASAAAKYVILEEVDDEDAGP